jgi:hypothetical protein
LRTAKVRRREEDERIGVVSADTEAPVDLDEVAVIGGPNETRQPKQPGQERDRYGDEDPEANAPT